VGVAKLHMGHGGWRPVAYVPGEDSGGIMANKTDWSGELGALWARNAEIMELMLSPFGDAAMDALGPLRGKTVLDLGCGGGATSLALAQKVGVRGAVVGLDVSPDLIELAGRRRDAGPATAGKVGFRCADAATADLAEGAFDAVFSQFGAMFFDEPTPAWAHLRKAAAPGAPLSIACWRAPRLNEWATLPLYAAKPHLPEVPPVPHDAPGPFAWSMPEETIKPILTNAGWKDVAWKELDRDIILGAGVAAGPDDDPLDIATDFTIENGPLSRRLKELPAETQEVVRKDVREALSTRLLEGRVVVKGAVWLVSATA
ncbi:MAG: class I SAM-dependent methyltransferase, partial [Pseudomonadota bacterium]